MTSDCRVLAVILAGGTGGRLGNLTQNRSKPSLPFFGSYRLIDFPLSNCVHSRIDDVWVLEQYLPHSLNDHLANGRPWDLDRTHGGLRAIPPFQQSEEDAEGFAIGNADALARHLHFLQDFEPDLIVLMSADHVTTLNLKRMIRHHLDSGAEATLAVKDLPGEDISRFSVVRSEDGWIRRFDYKPERPAGSLVATETFVFSADLLFDQLRSLRSGGPLHDYGDELLPRFIERGRTAAFPHEGYWRDVGTIQSYWQGHMDLIDNPGKLRFDNQGWPILSNGSHRGPARIEPGSQVEKGVICAGAVIHGRVRRSVIGPGTVIEEGATVEDSVILEDARIGNGVTVRNAIVDAGIRMETDLIGDKEVALSEPGPRPHLRARGEPE